MVQGKIAVVTGAASGIGRAVCSLLASRGATVVAADVSKQNLEQLDTDSSLKFQVDVSSKTQVDQLYQDVISRVGRAPQLLINSAGITRDNLIPKISEKDWDKVLAVNLKGTFFTTQVHSHHLIKHLSESTEEGGKLFGLSGSIVNISSVSSKGNQGQANYAASKAGVIALTKTAAQELGRNGIRVNCVLPGFVETPMTDVIPDKLMERYLKFISLRRKAQPFEVANLIAFLASEESSYMTGTAIDIDGGLGA